ncbi:hypothetical protein [Methylobacterium brachythecii]|nr:hypothetical protein [Methylobacterium brachythecii]MBB3900933.1 hypothetical protein [Methylobacterium brachythecii]
MSKATSTQTKVRISSDLVENDTGDPVGRERPQRRRIRWVAKPRHSNARSFDTVLPLSTRAIACLAQRLPRRRGRDGDLEELLLFGGQLSPSKMLRIAGGCTRAELLATRGVGVGTVDEIERWIEAHGYHFRPEPTGVTAALGKAIEHLEALVETRAEDAYFQAFLALPALKKALRAAPGKRTHLRSVYRTAPAGPAETD